MSSRRFAAIAAALALFWAQGAQAAGGEGTDAEAGVSPTKLEVAWSIYVAGLGVGKMVMSATLKGDDYSAVSSVATSGLVQVIWESKIKAESEGTIQDGKVVPVIYKSRNQMPDKLQTVDLLYEAGFPATLVANPIYNTARFPVTDEQKTGTIDPLSAMVAAAAGVTASAENPCGTVLPVFDGKRRYDIRMKYMRTIQVMEGEHPYRGSALACQLEYVQIAGFKPSLDPEDREFPVIHVELAQVQRPDAPEHPLLVPLKVWADTAFGMAIAQANHVKVNGGAPVAFEKTNAAVTPETAPN